MEWREFTLEENDAGRRLDRVALRLLPHRTHGQIYSALRKRLIKLNGRKAQPGEITRESDTLSAAGFLFRDEREESRTAPHGQNKTSAPEQIPPEQIQVIFQNRHLLFVNKPRGIPVHGEGSLAQILLASPLCFASAADGNANRPSERNSPKKSISFRPGPLHRLDKGTTGIIAFSASLAGAQWFSEEIRKHSIRKTYVGIAEGIIEREEEWLEKIDGKEARTKAVPLAYGELFGQKATLARYEIATGRKHQIRIHSGAHGHPLAGDTFHGSRIESAENAGQGTERFFLHALKMEFPQNSLGVPSALRARLPEAFRAAVAEGFCAPEEILAELFAPNNLKNIST